MMRTRFALALAVVLSLSAMVGFAESTLDLPVVVVFYADGCPDCALMEELLVGLAYDLPPSAIRRYEISQPGSMRILRRLEAAYEMDSTTSAIPIVFVGDTYVIGAGRSQEFRLRDAIGRCVTVGCPSPLARIEITSFPWKDVARLALIVGLIALLALLQFS
ncbi:MAG: hypothetical protein PHV11_02345 [Candidatus Bipolaricaulis sp.]|nr:hypothetical protein [Candidatus Bipolaricaulis sp.]